MRLNHDRTIEERVAELERRMELMLTAFETGALAISRLTYAVVNIEQHLDSDEQPPAPTTGATGGECE